MATKATGIKKRDLSQWVKRQVYARRDEGKGYCNKIVLRHLSVGKSRGSEVQSFPLEIRMEENQIAELIENIIECATGDANGIGGNQKYVLHAYFSDGEGEEARFPFRIAAEDDENDAGDAFDSEPPTKAGIVAQLMRHNEATMRTSHLALTGTMNALARDNEQLRQENEKLRAERRDMLETYEGLLTQQHERALATKEHEYRVEQKREMFSKLMLIGPAIVNRIAGKKLLPEKTTPEAMAIKSLMDSFTQEQMQQLQGVLTPDQLISIMNLYEAQRGKDSNGVQTTPTGTMEIDISTPQAKEN